MQKLMTTQSHQNIKNWFLEKKVELNLDKYTRLKKSATIYCLRHPSASMITIQLANIIDPDQVEDLRYIFQSLDEHGEGSAYLNDINARLQFGAESQALTMAVVKQADIDGTGEIEYPEFLSALIDSNALMNEVYLEKLFDKYDLNSVGRISRQDFLQLFQREEFNCAHIANDEIGKIYDKYIQDDNCAGKSG